MFCCLLENKVISPLSAGCGVVQGTLPFQSFPFLPTTPKPQPSHSCTCGQASYEHQCIYTLFHGRETGIGTSEQRFYIAEQGIMHSPQRISEIGESKEPSQGPSACWPLPESKVKSSVLSSITKTKGPEIPTGPGLNSHGGSEVEEGMQPQFTAASTLIGIR